MNAPAVTDAVLWELLTAASDRLVVAQSGGAVGIADTAGDLFEATPEQITGLAILRGRDLLAPVPTDPDFAMFGDQALAPTAAGREVLSLLAQTFGGAAT